MLMMQLKKFSNFASSHFKRPINLYDKDFKFPIERVCTAHDGVFLEDYQDSRLRQKECLREELQIPDHDKLIVHTGSLYKGGAELFGYTVKPRSFGRLLFIHIGGSVTECNDWANFYKAKNIHNVIFRPHTSFEMIKKYQSCADALLYVCTRITDSLVHLSIKSF